ncbi:PQQ-binding-like beta-propeller repeat protein [Streptomyces erythrochromogenes]|uniref:hypothetical protein n=1 Tax=Streptomyces erythrochromogenes TaxID=285574 RepID=UPI0038196632|nr:PQQ-like beta-propeller repeat protein [Streptomyces erythrochromogenes]
MTGDDTAVSYGIDTASHGLRWTQPGLEAVHTGSGTAAGLFHTDPLTYVPVGVDLATGTEKWRGEKTYAMIMDAAGPGTVRVAGPQVGEKGDQLLDVTSGTVRATMPPRLRAASCTHDGAATLVCAPGFTVAAVDAASGALLWSLKPDEAGRTPPTVTAVWHGRVYGRAVGGPVVLDDNRLYGYPAGG